MIKEENRFPERRSSKNYRTFESFVEGEDRSDNGVDFIKVVHSDNTETRYYIKQQDYSFIVNIVRKYIRLLVPVLFAIVCILFALPFMSSGPIYLVALKDQFLIPC